MVKLGGLNLGYDLIWTDRHSSYQVLQSQIITVGNGQIIFADAMLVNRPVTLMATENQGWIHRDVIEQLKYLASLPGEELAFDFHGLETFPVIFKHHDPPALELTPLVAGGELGLWFIGTIKLISI